MDNAVYDQVKLAKDGKWQAGQFEYGLRDGGVALTEMKVMGDKIPADVRQKLAEISSKIAQGEIKVEHYTGLKK